MKTTHQVTRLTVTLEGDFEGARERIESTIPSLDGEHLKELVTRKASWSEVVADANASAPLGFYIFWKLDVHPMMSLNGNTAKCCEYLIGNHTIAERMFRIDPTVMLYVPLRAVLFQEIGGATTFAIEQPSSQLSSLESETIAAVGLELDQKLDALLSRLEPAQA